MKSVIYEFDPVIYPFPLLITKDCDPEDLRTRFHLILDRKNCTEIENQFDPDLYTGAKTGMLVRKDSDRMYYMINILQPDTIDIGELVHEVFHVNTFNSWWLNFDPPQPGADEPQAYFCGWVARCVDSVLKDNPEKMKGKLLND